MLSKDFHQITRRVNCNSQEEEDEEEEVVEEEEEALLEQSFTPAKNAPRVGTQKSSIFLSWKQGKTLFE